MSVQSVITQESRMVQPHSVSNREQVVMRSVPGRTEKRHHSGEGAAEMRNQNGCDERKLSHVTLHAKS
jgi:hypothetical protein